MHIFISPLCIESRCRPKINHTLCQVKKMLIHCLHKIYTHALIFTAVAQAELLAISDLENLQLFDDIHKKIKYAHCRDNRGNALAHHSPCGSAHST